MIYEKSCGAVVYYSDSGKRLYLIEHMLKGHYSICKGHVEGNETEHETARREIMEETSLSVRFLDGYRECIHYSPYDGCMKQVVFFLAEAESMQVKVQPEEVESVCWLPIDEAVRLLTHESDKEILLKAEAFAGNAEF